ncbi:MAG: intradiol ring-cleavage dioxygenase [Rhodospirillaceae bacterium]|jgi:protocatechuate 3,4-dioxygenase, beta subunit|nr:intradiol ring-cleavage dioxygenase [Rhodospirillaceae bacterium]MBT5459497.1 intradiol ring-cleavage dioxygenase [Rhodospirillaceae bacterium]
MSRNDGLTRRSVVGGLLGGAVLSASGRASAASLMATPFQNQGPFYPMELPLDRDNDLVQVTGRPTRAAGELVHLFGRVLDTSGGTISDAKVEIWQCDSKGRYHHPRDFNGPADPDFQGYGTTLSDHAGAWRFRTIKPVPYTGRTPHIHFIVSVPGAPRLTTQMYLKGHPQNNGDHLFQSLGSQRLQASVSVAFKPAPKIAPGVQAGNFDIVIGGNTSAG